MDDVTSQGQVQQVVFFGDVVPRDLQWYGKLNFKKIIKTSLFVYVKLDPELPRRRRQPVGVENVISRAAVFPVGSFEKLAVTEAPRLELDALDRTKNIW